jgi:hypothetical protein
VTNHSALSGTNIILTVGRDFNKETMKRLHLLLSGLSFLAASVAFSQAAPNLGHTVVGSGAPGRGLWGTREG